MASSAISAAGTIIKLGDAASSETFTAIAEVLDFNGPSFSAKTTEVTPLDTTDFYEEVIVTMLSAGDVTFNLNFTSAGFDSLWAIFNARSKRNYQIVIPDSGSTTFQFSAAITSMPLSGDKEKQVGIAVTLKIDGKPTKTP